MHRIFSFFVRIAVFLIHMRHWKEVFKSLQLTISANYDEKTRMQRADETMGIALLQEALMREMIHKSFLPHSGWEFEVSSQLGLQAARLLTSAGWNKQRIIRKVDQIMEQISGEKPPDSPV